MLDAQHQEIRITAMRPGVLESKRDRPRSAGCNGQEERDERIGLTGEEMKFRLNLARAGRSLLPRYGTFLQRRWVALHICDDLSPQEIISP